MVKIFSQKFFVYHGCGAWYDNGANKIVSKNRKCIRPTYEPFWKKPNDVCYKVETRAQLKLKSTVKNDYIRRYIRFINGFDQNKGYSSSDYSTDDESTDDKSITPGSSYNETRTKTITKQSNAIENLIIDENQSEPISNTQNLDNKNELTLTLYHIIVKFSN